MHYLFSRTLIVQIRKTKNRKYLFYKYLRF